MCKEFFLNKGDMSDAKKLLKDTALPTLGYLYFLKKFFYLLKFVIYKSYNFLFVLCSTFMLSLDGIK